jgi:hypothetical protein
MIGTNRYSRFAVGIIATRSAPGQPFLTVQ